MSSYSFKLSNTQGLKPVGACCMWTCMSDRGQRSPADWTQEEEMHMTCKGKCLNVVLNYCNFCNNSINTSSPSLFLFAMRDCRQACLSGCHLPCPRPDSLQISLTTSSSTSLWQAWEFTHLRERKNHFDFLILRFESAKETNWMLLFPQLLLHAVCLCEHCGCVCASSVSTLHMLLRRPWWLGGSCTSRSCELLWLCSHFLGLTMEQGLGVKEWKWRNKPGITQG